MYQSSVMADWFMVRVSVEIRVRARVAVGVKVDPKGQL